MQQLVDIVLASRRERFQAGLLAIGAVNAHGDNAAGYLRMKLRDPRRARYQRSIRLAIRLVRKERARQPGERLSNFFRLVGPPSLPGA